MPLRILGEHPLARDDQGRLKSRIGTVFLDGPALVTVPGIHAFQRTLYLDLLNSERLAAGQRELTEAERDHVLGRAVDLIMEEDAILIRPEPEAMPLAFQADERLQEIASKAHIRFLYVINARVRDALRDRGEYWRISPLPRSPEEMRAMIGAARMRMNGPAVYYYNKLVGTRLLTLAEFTLLGALPDDVLRGQLRETQEYAARRNRLGYPEVGFFLAGKAFGAADFAGLDFLHMDDAGVRAAYVALRDRYAAAVPADLHEDNADDLPWRNQMIAALLTRTNETVTDAVLGGLSPEFCMQIEWLPGGRIEEGELMFDAVFDELERTPGSRELQALCDPRTRAFIFNYIREFGDIEYVNVGHVSNAMVAARRNAPGRRDTYIAEVKQMGARAPDVRILRMQKWGIPERLDAGKNLLQAIIESEEYTDYILDRRLGCRQLGMRLPSRIVPTRITERYMGSRAEFQGQAFWNTYYERDYIDGIASDKIPLGRFRDPRFALRLAARLGEAAAPNMLVGRMDSDENVLFDQGDEIVVLGADGLPESMVIADHTGTFVNYLTPLEAFAGAYAQPINRRAAFTPDPQAFATTYLEALRRRLEQIVGDYRKRRRAFDSLFKHRRRDVQGSFAYRWEKVLERLDHTDVPALLARIRRELIPQARPPEPPPPP